MPVVLPVQQGVSSLHWAHGTLSSLEKTKYNDSFTFSVYSLFAMTRDRPAYFPTYILEFLRAPGLSPAGEESV